MEKDLPIIFYDDKNMCVVIPHETAEARCDGGISAHFDGHEWIHKNKRQYYVLDEDGRCQKCGSGNCRRIRVRVLRSLARHNTETSAFPRHATAGNWKHIKVRNKRRAQKDKDGHLIRSFEPPTREWIAKRIADLQPTKNADQFRKSSNFDGIQFDNLDALAEIFELEIQRAKMDERDGFPGAQEAERKSQRKQYIEWLSNLEKNPVLPYQQARQIIRFRNLLFQPGDRSLDLFDPFLREMARYAKEEQEDEYRRLKYAESVRADSIEQAKYKLLEVEKRHSEARKNGNRDLEKKLAMEMKPLKAQVYQAKKMTLPQEYALAKKLAAIRDEARRNS